VLLPLQERLLVQVNVLRLFEMIAESHHDGMQFCAIGLFHYFLDVSESLTGADDGRLLRQVG
jgi:hypothetical protein